MSIEKALALAKERESDLVEVAPKANPPVCKIMDFGKFLYKQKKHEQKQKKAQKQGEVKSIRLSMRIGDHDMAVKVAKAIEFLGNRNVVKVALTLKGREFTHMNLAFDKINQFAALIAEKGKLEEKPKKQGNNIIMVIAPQ